MGLDSEFSDDSSRANSKRILCYCSNMLGLKTISDELKDALDEAGITADFVYFEYNEAYRASTPRFFSMRKLSENFDGISASRYVLKNVDLNRYDIIFVVSHQIAVPLKDLPATKKLIVLFDSTPKMAHRSNRQYKRSFRSIAKAVLASLFDTYYFGPLFKRADYLLPMSTAAKNSILHDYSLPNAIADVIYTPVDVCAPKTLSSGFPKLIFVGNNFQRKGGDFLLKLFNDYLSVNFQLFIISKDPTVLDIPDHPNLTIIPGIPREELLNLYREMDIFILPTLRDDGGSAVCEALGAGLPVVVRDAGAQGDWVKSNENGMLMPYESTEKDWSNAINSLIKTPEQYASYSENSILTAEKLLSKEIFIKKILKSLSI